MYLFFVHFSLVACHAMPLWWWWYDDDMHSNCERRSPTHTCHASAYLVSNAYPSPPPDSSLGGGYVEEEGPHPCSLCCLVFSCCGMLFLTIIGLIFNSDSVYIKNPEGGKTRKEGAGSCFGAAACYFITMCISAW